MDQQKYENMIERLLLKTKRNDYSGNRREGYKDGLLAAVSMIRSEFKLPRPGTKGWMSGAELLNFWEYNGPHRGAIKAFNPSGNILTIAPDGATFWQATDQPITTGELLASTWRILR